jgi:diguanylate cyclase (GGDEF)-like protein
MMPIKHPARSPINERARQHLQHRDGRWLWFAARVFDLRKDPDVRGIVTSLQDMSAERQLRDRHARQLVQQAEWDGLTLLPNRRRLTKDLADLAVPSTDNVGTWLLFCDFDAFKNINDTLGHDVGDELLRVAAQRLVDLATPHQAYRFGGDEFVIVLEASTREEAERLAARAVEVNKDPISVHEHQLTLTLSVGVARATTHGHESLLRDADLAMYAAKAAGKNRFLTFDEPMRATAMRRHLLGQALPDALRKGELRLVYQPRVDARTARCVGFEALLRWRSATLGDVSPGEFIPVAEEAGLITKLGAFVLREACKQLAAWRAEGLTQHISVNVSVHQLAERERFVDLVLETLRDTRLPAECLELEVTESVFMKQPDVMVGVLRELRALGVTLAVDDFGTGYSSMAYIRTFPIQTLKIDRTFVGELENSRESRAISAAILGLARELSIQTVAEGVESSSQAQLLRDMGCNELQGYHIARPLEADAARAFAQGTGEHASVGTVVAASDADGQARESSAQVAQ